VQRVIKIMIMGRKNS